MKRDLDPLKEKLRKDSRVRRLAKAFDELPLYRIPVKDLLKEVETIHKTRSVRYLSTNNPKFLEKIVDASVHDQSQRSRLTEISAQCMVAKASLEDALDPMREYLLIAYASDLTFLRTKDERRAFIDMALSTFNRFLNRITTLSNVCELIVKDIDKAAFSLRLQLDSFKIHGAPERSL